MKPIFSRILGLSVAAVVSLLSVTGSLFAAEKAAQKDVIAEVDAKKQRLGEMKAEVVETPTPSEPSSAKEFLKRQQVPLHTEAELRKKRAALLARNTTLKRKEFQKGARVRALARDPSLSQLPEYRKAQPVEEAPAAEEKKPEEKPAEEATPSEEVAKASPSEEKPAEEAPA